MTWWLLREPDLSQNNPLCFCLSLDFSEQRFVRGCSGAILLCLEPLEDTQNVLCTFFLLGRQLCIYHFTSSHLCTAAQPETGWGVLQRFAMAHPTPFNCGHHGEERKELSICVAITQPILFSVKGNCSKLLPLQSSEVHLKFWIDLTLFKKKKQQFQDGGGRRCMDESLKGSRF